MVDMHGHGQYVDMQQTAKQKAWHILGQPPSMSTLKVVGEGKMKAMTNSSPASKYSSFDSRLPSAPAPVLPAPAPAPAARNVLPVLATKVNSASMELHTTSGSLDAEQASGGKQQDPSTTRVHRDAVVHTPIVREDGLQVSLHHAPHSCSYPPYRYCVAMT